MQMWMPRAKEQKKYDGNMGAGPGLEGNKGRPTVSHRDKVWTHSVQHSSLVQSRLLGKSGRHTSVRSRLQDKLSARFSSQSWRNTFRDTAGHWQAPAPLGGWGGDSFPWRAMGPSIEHTPGRECLLSSCAPKGCYSAHWPSVCLGTVGSRRRAHPHSGTGSCDAFNMHRMARVG